MWREAIEFCKAGYKIIPLKGKEPFWPQWQHRAIEDPFDALEIWPGDGYNVGIVCGGGMFVIDLDVKDGKDGPRALATLIARHGPLPETRTVRTQSGGLHLYFRTPDGGDVANAHGFLKDDIGDGIDIKGLNGQVAAPGSVYEGRTYALERDVPIATAPNWLVELMRAPPIKSAGAAVAIGKLDRPEDIKRCRDWLENSPDVYEGGRDNAAFAIACRFLDFGASPASVREMLDEWNEQKCNPPLPDNDLNRIADSATRNRQSPIGRDSITAGFAPVELPAPPAPAPDGATPISPEDQAAFDAEFWDYDDTEETEETIPPRAWIANRRLIRGALALLVAPGSIGKSLLSLQWACAIASGYGEWCGLDVREKCNVMVVNNEDPLVEMRGRLSAVSRQFGLNRSDVHRRVKLRSGADRGSMRVVERIGRSSEFQLSKRGRMLVANMRANKIGVAIFDPFVSLHPGNENDNVEMDNVCEVFKQIARETGAAILLVHHSKKPPQAGSEGFAGSADAGRGASAIINAVRIAYTAFNMSLKDAERYKVPAARRHRYLRIDDAKANLFLASPDAQWFERHSVPLPSGEDGGALVPAQIHDDAEHQTYAICAEIAKFVSLDAENPISVNALAKALIENSPFFNGMSEASARNAIVAALRCADTTFDGKRLHFVPVGKTGGTVYATAAD